MLAQTQFLAYRLATVAKSLKTLYTLPKETVEAFVNSYRVYDHDWSDEKALIDKMGSDYYNKMKSQVLDYYTVLNHLCAIGQVEKMYIPPAMDLSKSILTNQKLFEKRVCQDLGLKEGDKALDVGCGRGRIAGHMSSMSKAHVTGINIDQTQLESARRFAHAKALNCTFLERDLNDLPLPFADESFDGIYQVQVFTYAKDLLALFKELYRVMKPKARFASLDWFVLDAYDPKNAHHADLMRRIKPLIGAIGTISHREYADLLRQAGFKIVVDENASIDGLQAPLIDNADKFFTKVTRFVKFLVKIKLLPKHFVALFDRMTQDGQAFVEADRMRLVTTSYYIVAEK